MIQGEQMDIWGGSNNEEYEAFVDKFKPKLTTDDCYTPPHIYDAVAEWVVNEYHLDRTKFVRPFYPGGDYQHFTYADDAIVVDNPPFSILSQITKWYQARGIPFFLFAPRLTIFRPGASCCSICVDAGITYENGAVVSSSFVTNLETCRIRSAPTLQTAIKTAEDKHAAETKKALPKYTYPNEVLTASMVSRFSKYGIDFRVEPDECVKIPALDSQKLNGKAIFGSGYLLSERAAAEHAAAERAAAERAAAERAAAERAAATVWELSDRERAIVQRLSQGG